MSVLFESVCDLWLTKPAPIPVTRKQGEVSASIVSPAKPVFGGPCLISCFLVFLMVLCIIVHTLVCNRVNHWADLLAKMSQFCWKMKDKNREPAVTKIKVSETSLVKASFRLTHGSITTLWLVFPVHSQIVYWDTCQKYGQSNTTDHRLRVKRED